MASIFDTIVWVAWETRYDAELDTTYRYNSRTAAWEVDGTGTPSSSTFATSNVQIGDIREDIDTGRSYKWNGTTWTLVVIKADIVDVDNDWIPDSVATVADNSISTAKIVDNAVSFDKLWTNVIQEIRVPISSAEILSLNTTPKTLIPAPWAWKVIQVLSVVFNSTFGTTAYDMNTQLSINYTSFTWPSIAYNPIILSTTSNWLDSSTVTSGELSENEPVIVTVLEGDPINWDGTLEVILTYRIVTI